MHCDGLNCDVSYETEHLSARMPGWMFLWGNTMRDEVPKAFQHFCPMHADLKISAIDRRTREQEEADLGDEMADRERWTHG